MSISVYRLKRVYDSDLFELGRLEGQWMHGHLNCTSDEATDYIHLYEGGEDAITAAERCTGGQCAPFDGTKEEHAAITARMKILIPKILAAAKADGQDGWTTLEVNW